MLALVLDVGKMGYGFLKDLNAQPNVEKDVSLGLSISV
jgi:hypothetical protein